MKEEKKWERGKREKRNKGGKGGKEKINKRKRETGTTNKYKRHFIKVRGKGPIEVERSETFGEGSEPALCMLLNTESVGP